MNDTNQPVIEIDGMNDCEMDFKGTTISTPSVPAIDMERSSRIGIRNATILGGSGDPKIAYRIHRITHRAEARKRRRYRRGQRRRDMGRWLRRPRFSALAVTVAVIAIRAMRAK